jgi:hypothetical protein
MKETLKMTHPHLKMLAFMIALGVFIASCDVLESDKLDPAKEIVVSDKPVEILSGKTAVIDLKSIISASGNYRYSASQPQYGKLESLGSDLLQYTPSDSIETDRDGFKLSIFNTDNVIVEEDSIFIILMPDTVNIDCHVWAWMDSVTNIVADSAIIIDVLSNDVLCVDRSQILVTLVPNDFRINEPLHGLAEVLEDGRIKYTPNDSFPGLDNFVYRITKPPGIPNPDDIREVSSARVYISGSAVCMALPVALNDTFDISFNEEVFIDSLTLDSINSVSTRFLYVAQNDFRCGGAPITLEIVTPPHGEIIPAPSVGTLGFYYKRPEHIYRGYEDDFRYRLCSNGVCAEADVAIIFK